MRTPQGAVADALAVLGYLAITLLLNAPVLGQLTAAIPSDVGDPLLNTWILWWNAVTPPWSSTYWHAPAFAPAPSALALSETLLGLTPITTPLQWLGAQPLTAYNLLFVLTPFLNGSAAYLLCRRLSGRRDAALVGGLYFMMAPYRAAQLPHVQTLATFYMPLALLGLHAYAATGRRRWLALLFSATVLNGLVSGYHLVYFAVPLVVALVWAAASAADWRRVITIGLTLAGAAAALVPVLLPYRRVHRLWDLRRGLDEMTGFSADLASFTSAAPPLWLGPLPTLIDKPEADVYPGLAWIACLLLGAIAARRRSPEGGKAQPTPAWVRALRAVLATVAVIAGLAALAGYVGGPFGVEWGPLRVSVTSLNKPLGAALSASLLVLALSPRLWRSARAGSVLGLYATVFVVATVLMLGPEGQVMGHRFWYKAPFAWLLELPGYDTVRVPARWASIQILAGAVLSALAVAAWRTSATRRYPRLVIAALCVALLVDGWFILPVAAVPQPLSAPVSADLVVELPRHGWVEDVAAMYRGTSHGRPVVNGYSGYGPPHYEFLAADLQAGCLESLDAVRAGRSLDVVVHVEAEGGASARDAAARQWPGAPETLAAGLSIRHVPPDAIRATTAYDDPIDLSQYCDATRRQATESP